MALFPDGYGAPSSGNVPQPPINIPLGIGLYPQNCVPPSLQFSAGTPPMFPVLKIVNNKTVLNWGSARDAGGAPENDSYYLVQAAQDPALPSSYPIGTPTANYALMATGQSAFSWTTTLPSMTLASPTFAGMPSVTNMTYTVTPVAVTAPAFATSSGLNKLQSVLLTVPHSAVLTLQNDPVLIVEASASKGNLCIVSASYSVAASSPLYTSGGDLVIQAAAADGPDDGYVTQVSFTGSAAVVKQAQGGSGVGVITGWATNNVVTLSNTMEIVLSTVFNSPEFLGGAASIRLLVTYVELGTT